MFHPLKPATRARLAQERRKARAQLSADVLARAREAYAKEPDREYAEAFWGTMITELEEAATART